ncbi:ccr4-not transcription complex subunit [Trifolium pratense]|uniref:Ccr4-not transcription complex subunit n=1 Tax=Trifolium pratense TaxID=57577 RepID=A0A2K3NRH0_TRIPR|nr:ccr4-not transcription complex subunit [Trifolium pratense]
MVDKGGKSCPICTEEMDLTDQHLKPCKCGYEICVWCWHHIMEMAQKDETEGRCPACRSPYDKERIVAMAANCRRLVAEMNSQHKKKIHKLKPKSSDGRKHLTDVRVIQRNLVYIIGLPLNLADENLLQRKEYFGRYGKVLKVSISRTSTGIIQHSANNSCCVYITYSKESEAVRCIQSVHFFVLEGLVLEQQSIAMHGSEMWSRVLQIIGATNNLHRRSGSVLPPPPDDPRHMSSATKVVSTSPLDIKGSCSSNGAANSTALPAANSWARCVSGSLPQEISSSCSSNLANRKIEASNDSQALLPEAVCTERSILDTKKSGEDENSSDVHSDSVIVPSELNKHHVGGNSQTCESNVINKVTVKKLSGIISSNCETSSAAFVGLDQDKAAPSVSTSVLEIAGLHDLNTNKAVSSRDVHGICSELSSVSINSHLEDSFFTRDSDRIPFTQNSINSSLGKHLHQDNGYCKDHSTTPAFWEDIIVDDSLNKDYDQQQFCKGKNNLASVLHSPCCPQNLTQSSHQLKQQNQICNQNHFGKPSESLTEPLGAGFEKLVESEDTGSNVDNKVSSDIGENHIISNILSLELDAWEDSLVKLLDESDEPYTSFKAPALRNIQDKNQSRFSFARHDGSLNGASDLQSFGIIGFDPKVNYASGGYNGNKDMFTGKQHPHAFPSSNSVLSDKFDGSPSLVPSKFSMAKAHATSPPGFSMSGRIPPGFSRGRVEQSCNGSVEHLRPQYAPPSVNIGRIGDVEFKNPMVLDPSRGIVDEKLNSVPFNLRQTLLPQFSPNEDEARLKMLLQQSTASQNLRLTDHFGNRFSPQSDAYRTSSRFLDQFQSNTPSFSEQLHSQQFNSNILGSNNQWGSWNDSKYFSGLSMSEVLNNEIGGYNNFIPSYENIKSKHLN